MSATDLLIGLGAVLLLVVGYSIGHAAGWRSAHQNIMRNVFSFYQPTDPDRTGSATNQCQKQTYEKETDSISDFST